jgi:hypothetical protein
MQAANPNIPALRQRLTPSALVAENRHFRGTGGVSGAHRAMRLRPGFLDRETGATYPSRFADGTPASIHILDGLPDFLVTARDARRRVLAVKATVVSGFLRGNRFLTREEAARALSA